MLLRNNILCYPIINDWIGELRLHFKLCQTKTLLVKRWHRGPFFIQKPFYLENNFPHIYLLHPPGGLVGGDRLSLFVNLGSGSQALLTTPGSNKFYSSNGNYVYIKQRFILNKDSILEWLPQSSIFFHDSKVIIDSKLEIKRGARFIFFETLCFNCIIAKKVCIKGILNISLSISLGKSVGLEECIRINHSDESILNKFWGYKINAIFFAMPCDVQMLNSVRILIAAHNVCAGGATLLDNLLVVRLLDNDNELIEIILRDLWSFLRPSIVRRKSVTPRVWLT